ncbi:MAG TPA: rRNA maturation RNase YbeY [Pirellulales bacterium]|nr:rRNA maturation RNase YbeY [Pirellulales bacterium]
MPNYKVSFAVDDGCDVDLQRLRAGVEWVLRDAGIARATVSVAIVDDATIHELNVRYLAHDWPTDVLSFLLESGEDSLEGEIVVSTDTATSMARELGRSPADELLLYVVHGALHLVGYDDQDDASRADMRAREASILARLGVADVS